MPTGGDLAKALGRVTAKTFMMPTETDMSFTVADCAAEQRLIPGSESRVLETAWGHIEIMGMNPNFMTQANVALRDLLGTRL